MLYHTWKARANVKQTKTFNGWIQLCLLLNPFQNGLYIFGWLSVRNLFEFSCQMIYVNKHCPQFVSMSLWNAILQVLTYFKAIYDISYLGSKTTMTSCVWTCLNSFVTAPLDLFGTGRERKIQNENICLQPGFEPTPRQSTTGKLQRLRPLGHEGLMVISS